MIAAKFPHAVIKLFQMDASTKAEIISTWHTTTV